MQIYGDPPKSREIREDISGSRASGLRGSTDVRCPVCELDRCPPIPRPRRLVLGQQEREEEAEEYRQRISSVRDALMQYDRERSSRPTAPGEGARLDWRHPTPAMLKVRARSVGLPLPSVSRALFDTPAEASGWLLTPGFRRRIARTGANRPSTTEGERSVGLSDGLRRARRRSDHGDGDASRASLLTATSRLGPQTSKAAAYDRTASLRPRKTDQG